MDSATGYNIAANVVVMRTMDFSAADHRAQWSQYPLVTVQAALDRAAFAAGQEPGIYP